MSSLKARLKASGLKAQKQGEFELYWQSSLSDYVSAMAWSPDGKTLAASSAAGEVALYQDFETSQATFLQPANGQSVDCLAFSGDGQFLAASGQAGQVNIWQMRSDPPELMATIKSAAAWIDHMVWSPSQNQLAFSLGKYVQVWDAALGDVAITLNFDTSSALDITWHPTGQWLSVSGYQGVKTWTAADWDDDPNLLMIPSASVAITWSPDGKYLASGNLDRTVTVLDWQDSAHPWLMQGFFGKIRCLAWSKLPTSSGAALLAVSSIEGIVVWEKQSTASAGWKGTVLAHHDAMVQSLQFRPDSFLLSSAAQDGQVCLWAKAQKLTQVLEGAPNGFSTLAWHPNQALLAAGGQQGELLIWTKTKRGQGFGTRW